MARGPKIGTLYILKATTKKSNVVVVTKEEISTDLWHKCLGHVSEKGLKILAGKSLLPSLNSYNIDIFNIVYMVGNKEFPSLEVAMNRK